MVVVVVAGGVLVVCWWCAGGSGVKEFGFDIHFVIIFLLGDSMSLQLCVMIIAI